MMKKRKEGFTLVELLIVMAVIAALMGALVPVALNAVRQANATRIAENLRAIQTAVQNYVYSERPAETPTLSDLKNSRYLSGNVNTTDYDIYYKTSSGWNDDAQSFTGVATAVVVYKTSDTNLQKAVHKAWPAATKITDINSGNSIGATVTIAKYW